jgi:ribosome-binding ATPase YchF (GTP1/OBG family)
MEVKIYTGFQANSKLIGSFTVDDAAFSPASQGNIVTDAEFEAISGSRRGSKEAHD